MEQLHRVLSHYLRGVTPAPAIQETGSGNGTLLANFIAANRVEGCSCKSLRYYESTLNNMLAAMDKPVKHITTDDLRQYLDKYQQSGGASMVTIDNIRRIFSGFFSWLEEENQILKSPVRRIHKVKTSTTVKETYSDEALELMRDHCGTIRELAMIDLLASTGMRVGELVKLNRADIDFTNRECVVFGKGDK
jgi:site-specific recombinase XerD